MSKDQNLLRFGRFRLMIGYFVSKNEIFSKRVFVKFLNFK